MKLVIVSHVDSAGTLPGIPEPCCKRGTFRIGYESIQPVIGDEESA